MENKWELYHPVEEPQDIFEIPENEPEPEPESDILFGAAQYAYAVGA
jgi:hypothetical protein